MALSAIWQFMDRDVTYKIVYGPKRSKSVRQHIFVIIYLRQKTSSDKIRTKTLY